MEDEKNKVVEQAFIAENRKHLSIPAIWEKLKIVLLIFGVIAIISGIIMRFSKEKDILVLWDMIDIVDIVLSIILPFVYFTLMKFAENFTTKIVAFKTLFIVSAISVVMSVMAYLFIPSDESDIIGIISILLLWVTLVIVGVKTVSFKNKPFKEINTLGYMLIVAPLASIICLIFVEDDITMEVIQLFLYALPITTLYQVIEKSKTYNETLNN